MDKPIEEIKIKRFFYPIGHGGFYAEKHKIGSNRFTIVYDCGSKSYVKANAIIEIAFKEKEVIDILFISHFDADHVNKINFLKKRTTIKNVVMPLLHKEEIYLLKNMFRVLKLPILRLLSNPKQFFDKNTKIIKIRPTDNMEGNIDTRNAIDLDNLNDFIQDSGRSIRKSSLHYEWVFIPYNYEHKERLKQLKEKLLGANFTEEDIIALQKDPEWTLKKIEIDIDKSTTRDKTKFKNLYNSLVSSTNKKIKINETSMLLYSGIVTLSKDNLFKKSCIFNFNTNKDLSSISKRTDKVSSLYTGDINLKDIDVKRIFSSLWRNIGTIQIPHHGSVENFEKSVLGDKYHICPISVSNSLTGHHPAKSVIDAIKSQDSYPVLVTKELDSGLIEYINNDDKIEEKKKRENRLGCLKNLLYLK